MYSVMLHLENQDPTIDLIDNNNEVVLNKELYTEDENGNNITVLVQDMFGFYVSFSSFQDAASYTRMILLQLLEQCKPVSSTSLNEAINKLINLLDKNLLNILDDEINDLYAIYYFGNNDEGSISLKIMPTNASFTS